MPKWEKALLPWDLLCSPGRIAWEGDIYTHTQTFQLLDQIGLVGQFSEKHKTIISYSKGQAWKMLQDLSQAHLCKLVWSDIGTLKYSSDNFL